MEQSEVCFQICRQMHKLTTTWKPNCEFLGTSTDWIDRNPQKAKALGLIKNGKHIAPTTPEQRIAVWPSKFRHSNEELKWLYRNRNIQARKMIAPYAFCANVASPPGAESRHTNIPQGTTIQGLLVSIPGY